MFITAIAFFIILSILVLIHELGHFTVARMMGVDIEEFGLGLPPRIIGKKIKSTIYSLNWLPIGGFVKLAGEDDEGELTNQNSMTKSKKEHYFWAKSKKQRAAILTAGVAMNFALAVAITTFLLTQGVNEPTGRVHVETVVAESPAAEAGIVEGDIVATFLPSSGDGVSVKIATPQQLIQITKDHAGTPVTLTLIREGVKQTVVLTPRKNPPQGQGPVGIAISDLEVRVYAWREAPLKAFSINMSRAWEMLRSLGLLIWRLVTLQPIAADVAGPIGIAQVTGQAVKFGWRAVLEFMSILSLNLAVLNILPIPALDGGRLAFVFLEKIFGRRVRPAFEKSTHQIGMIILFALILLVSINDILRLVRS